MKVQLRFRCWNKEVTDAEGGGTVSLGPVIPSAGELGAEEIANFYKWTPGGSLQFSTINTKAMEQFEVGADYYITVERVAPVPAEEATASAE